MFHSRAKAAHYLSYPLYLIKLRLKLIDLLQDGSETSNLGISHFYSIASSVVLGLCCDLGGTVQLRLPTVHYHLGI